MATAKNQSPSASNQSETESEADTSRTNISFLKRQMKDLKDHKKRTGESVNSAVRRAVDMFFENQSK